jgi:hypothetical protein
MMFNGLKWSPALNILTLFSIELVRGVARGRLHNVRSGAMQRHAKECENKSSQHLLPVLVLSASSARHLHLHFGANKDAT